MAQQGAQRTHLGGGAERSAQQSHRVQVEVALQSEGVLHFVGHGKYDAASPLDSYLLFVG